MRYRPADRDPADPRLGRYVPDDWTHIDRYPLGALDAPPQRVPVVLGVNWYAEFDQPVDRDGRHWIAPDGAASLTRIRGGHAICLEPGQQTLHADWHTFYDQGVEGACVGFAWSRCMSILNGARYTARWLWDRAKELDEWPQTNPGDGDGTSVRAAGEVLRSRGHVSWRRTHADKDHVRRATYRPAKAAGIATFRWARDVTDIHTVLANPEADQLGAVPVLNSWGTAWPYRVWMPDDVLDLLLREDGEAAIPTDR